MGSGGGAARAQAALDFLISYGVVLLGLAVAIVLLYNIGVNNSYSESPYCTPEPSFSCGFYSINGMTGVLQIQLAQATGGAITVHGIACSADLNSNGNLPGEGNAWVTQNAVYYPANNLFAPTLYSGATGTYTMYCYNSGGIASGLLGNNFAGYIWLNYSIPNYGTQVQLAATINAKYT